MTALRFVTQAVLGATLALSAAAPAAQAQSAAAARPAPSAYFPLPTQSRWIDWEYDVYPNGPVRIAVRPKKIHAERIAPTGPGFIRRARFDGYLDPQASATVLRYPDGKVKAIERAGSSFRLAPWYDFGAAPGVNFPTRLQAALFPGVRIEAQNGQRDCIAITPAGVFTNCLRVDYSDQIADAGLLREFFAPGLGLVLRIEETGWGSFDTKLTNLRTSQGFALVGRRPLDAQIDVTPAQIVIGGAPRPDWMPRPRYFVDAKVRLTSARSLNVYEPSAPVTFYAVDETGGTLCGKATAARKTRSGILTIDSTGVEYAVRFELTHLPIGKIAVAAETRLVPGAAPAKGFIEVIPAP